jgi:HEAT repeat protein
LETAGIFTTDRSFVIRSWDPWIAEATGIPTSEAVGKSLFDLFPGIASRGLAPRFVHVVENEAVEILAPAFHHYLLPCTPKTVSPNFSFMQQHVTISPIYDHGTHGTVTGAIVTIEDVTARLDRERELAQQLVSPDEATRLHAAQTLAREAAGAGSLAQAFGDSSWKVRSAAVSGFAQRSGEEITEALTMALRDQHRDLSVVNSALSALAISGKDVLPNLLEHLQSDDPDLRTYVALALGHMNDMRAEDALIEALRDADANVRYHAIEALGRLRSHAAAPALADIAASGDFFLGFAALDALGSAGDGVTARRILPLLGNEDLSEAAVEMAGRIGGEEWVGPICERLNAGNVAVGICATALARIHARLDAVCGYGHIVGCLAVAALDDAGTQRVIDAARSEEPDECMAIVVGWLPNTEAVSALVGMLDDVSVRQLAMDALVKHGAAAVEAVAGAVDSESDDTAKAAIAVLGRIGTRSVLGRLVDALGDGPDRAIVAAHALGGLGDAAAFDPLFSLLDDPLPAVRYAAVAALNSIGADALPARAIAMLRNPSPRLRESAARIAGYFGYADATEGMIELSHDSDPLVRRAALEHIAFFDDPRIPALLRASLHDGAQDIRVAAARGIARLEGIQLGRLLAEALAHEDPWVRYHAAQSTDATTDTALLVPLCAQAETDPHLPARLAAIGALGRIAHPATTRVLARLVEDEMDQIAIAALDAIGRSADKSARGTLVAALRSRNTARSLAALHAIEHAAMTDKLTSDLAHAALRTDSHELALSAVRMLGKSACDAVEIANIARLPWLREEVAAQLAIRAHIEIAHILRLLGMPDTFLQVLAIEALGRTTHPEAGIRLARFTHDDDRDLREAALLSLERIDLRAMAASPRRDRTSHTSSAAAT